MSSRSERPPGGAGRRWSRYQPGGKLRDETGYVIDPPTDTSTTDTSTTDTSTTDTSTTDTSTTDTRTTDGSRPAVLPLGCLAVLVFVIIPLAIGLMLALGGGSSEQEAAEAADPANPIDPGAIVPIDAEELRAELDRVARIEEVQGLPVSSASLSPDSTRLSFYRRKGDEQVGYVRYEGQPGYEIRIEDNPFEFIDDLLYDLDDLDPVTLEEVSAAALDEAADPRHYGMIVDRDLSTEELSVSVVVTEADDSRSFIYRTDSDGKFLENVVLAD